MKPLRITFNTELLEDLPTDQKFLKPYIEKLNDVAKDFFA